jgi:pimeloyl-ACP methyl ester carboxylesterase
MAQNFTFQWEGITLAYTDSGTHGLPLLFLHGNNCSSLIWQKIFQSNLNQSYRLLALDFPGHGKSQNALQHIEAYCPTGFKDAIRSWIDYLKLDTFIIIGHSLGGHVALQALHNHGGTRGFILMGTPPLKKPFPADAFLPNPNFNLLFMADISNHEAEILARDFFFIDSNPNAFVINDILRTDAEFKNNFMKDLAQLEDEVEIINQLTKPLALVHGQHDALVNHQYMESLQIKTLWQNKIHYAKGVGHMVPLEAHDFLIDLIQEFCKDAIRDLPKE